MKNTLLLASLAISTCSLNAVTIQFSNFGNSTQIGGVDCVDPLNGVTWGIVADTANDGFDSYGVSGGTASFTDQTFLDGSDDFLFLSANPTTNFIGSAGTVTQIIFNLDANVTGGENFAIIWFDGVGAGGSIAQGTLYGLIEDVDYVVPTSNSDNLTLLGGSTTGLHCPTLTFGDTSIPEPSSTLLVTLGGLGLLARRRK